MINISSPTPVSWPTPPSTAVAPVSATTPVKPVQSGGRDAQTDLEARREARLPRPRAGAAGEAKPDGSDAPPLLPREAAAQGSPAVSPGSQQAAAGRAEQALQKAEADKASHKKAMERLQDVLSSMWAASAAVVDQALGLSAGRNELPGNQSDTAPDLSAVAASTIQRRLPPPPLLVGQAPEQAGADAMPWPVLPPADDEAAAVAAPEVPGGEVIAYDENGNSSLAPLEAGTLLSERA